MLRTRICCAAVALTALITVGCSETPARLSLTGPTSINAAAAGHAVNSTAGVVNRTQGYVQDAGTVGEWAAQSGWVVADGLVVEGTAEITAATGTCPDKVVTVLGVPVTVNSSTTFGTGLTCAGLTIGTTVHITGLLTFSSSSFSVVATNISLDSGGGTPTGTAVTGEVASFTGSCPALTITLTGTGGTVVTNSTTTFDPTDSCGTIGPGVVIQANGTRDSSGHLVATSVAIENEETGSGGHGRGRRVGGEGTIGSVRGTCPSLVMVVRGFRVHTSASTTFEGGMCGDIRPGTHADIQGETRSDGGLNATRVKILRVAGGGH